MAEPQNPAGLDGTQSVSALGLRWAALRGMLNSPLITVEDQRPLRDELLRELSTIEQDFSALQSRNTMEISAKVDIAKSALQERLPPGQSWLIELLESIQTDLHAVNAKAAQPGTSRPITNLTRNQQQRPDESAAPSGPEASASSSAA